ncbi:MAG: 4-alpha-glucanotransferase [Candidatus Enteromonas sp.]|nr:4-alpha-glucanotransferase [Candidatus Enteromonas sp.]
MNEHKRLAGLLCSVTSLPSKHGIGDFGPCGYELVDALAKSGFSLWQILPLNPIGYGHSPYQPYSSYAIDEQFISLELLQEDGLLEEVPPLPLTPHVDYEAARAFKLPLLRKAFEADKDATKKIRAFEAKEPWVKAYAAFAMFHRRYPMSWNLWPEEAKNWIQTKKRFYGKDLADFRFEKWLQMKAYEQWDDLHSYAKKHGIAIIGDIPFYVGFDSCDVWEHLDAFLINAVTLEPDFIAGVPPDYFSTTGQRWGNPIYDWEYLEKTDFAFLQERILRASKIYDVIRLDHFRAFDTFWKIPSSCPTAIEGQWIEPPGRAFFDSLFQKDPELREKIIAEDLGDLRPEVLLLRDHYGFPGMNVVEFTFEDAEIAHKGSWHDENMVAYLGTHDNDTMRSYFEHLPSEQAGRWEAALAHLGFGEGDIVSRFSSYCLHLPAKWAILSLQDVLGLGEEARTNVPSTVNSVNWTYRATSMEEIVSGLASVSPLISSSGREA